MTLKTLITVVLGAGALMVGAQSALAQGPTTSNGLGTGVMTQEEKALLARSQGLNEIYGLGGNVPPTYETYGQSSAKEATSLASYYKLVAQPIVPESNPVVVHDHGDATQAQLDAQSTSRPELESNWSFSWPQVGIGLGVGMLLLFGLFLTVRNTRNPVAH